MDKAIFSGFCLLIVCFLAVVYYRKPRLDNSDTRIFGSLIITNIALCFLHTMFVFLISASLNKLLLIAIYLYLIGLMIVPMHILIYTLLVSFPNALNGRVKLYGYISLLFFSVIICFLPIHPHVGATLNDIYASGAAIDFTYIWGSIYILFVLIFAVYGLRRKENRIKLLPIFAYVAFRAVIAIIQTIYPETILSTPAETFLVLTMYFTIENPDLQMIEKLRVEKERADKANRAKSDFLASISHEMKTPLNAIVNFAIDAEDYSSEMPDDLKSDLKNIRISTEILSETVGNILDITKFENNIIDSETVTYDFRKEVAGRAQITSTRLEGKPVKFTCNIADNIPKYLIGDKKKVMSVTTNLLSNAFKYTENGSVTLDISCKCKQDDCMLTIRVADTGRGIESDMLDKIFEKFNRLDAGSKTATEGTGLGLAITKHFVDMMNGAIEITSDFGSGSVFTVQLTQQIHREPKFEPQWTHHSFDEFGKCRLMVVDDNNINREVVSLQFKNSDIAVTEAASGSECLDLIRSGEKFDIILMDMVMPGMHGNEVMAHLKDIPGFNTPVIVLTADITVSPEKMLEEGFFGFLSKPLDKDSLWNEMNKALKNKKP